MPLITLNEAITLLTEKTPRKPKEEEGRFEKLLSAMKQNAYRACVHMSGIPDGLKIVENITGERLRTKNERWVIPTRLLYAPDIVAEILRKAKPPLTTEMQSVLETAEKQAQILSDSNRERDTAFAFILEEAREGRIKLFGRNRGYGGVRQIPQDILEKNIIADRFGRKLSGKLPDTDIFFDDVQVDDAEYKRLLADTPSTPSAKHENQRQEVLAWLDDDSLRLSKLDDKSKEKELRRRFPNVLGRRMLLREHRAKNPDLWPRKPRK